MATRPTAASTGSMPCPAPDRACAPVSAPLRAAQRKDGMPERVARWTQMALVCGMALAIVLAPGCTVRSRGQYEASVGKTARP